MPTDVARESDLVALREAGLAAYGTIDVVMNNVGVVVMGPPESLPDEAWQRASTSICMSIARSNRVFLPLLIEQGRGHVVNTASASGLLAYGFDRLPYIASKHAVVGITEALALYLATERHRRDLPVPERRDDEHPRRSDAARATSATPRAPQHALSEPDVVGEAVADAVTAGTFLVTTAPEMHQELIDRATDLDAYLQARIAELSQA